MAVGGEGPARLVGKYDFVERAPPVAVDVVVTPGAIPGPDGADLALRVIVDIDPGSVIGNDRQQAGRVGTVVAVTDPVAVAVLDTCRVEEDIDDRNQQVGLRCAIAIAITIVLVGQHVVLVADRHPIEEVTGAIGGPHHKTFAGSIPDGWQAADAPLAGRGANVGCPILGQACPCFLQQKGFITDRREVDEDAAQ